MSLHSVFLGSSTGTPEFPQIRATASLGHGVFPALLGDSWAVVRFCAYGPCAGSVSACARIRVCCGAAGMLVLEPPLLPGAPVPLSPAQGAGGCGPTRGRPSPESGCAFAAWMLVHLQELELHSSMVDTSSTWTPFL